jgi:hypothetical protein
MRGNTSTTFNPKAGWGVSGKLITGSSNKQVSVQADFPATGTYTIAFSKDSNAKELNPIVAEALITWVVEGNYVTRRINVADGVSISGTAQNVKVVIVDATSTFTGPTAGVEYGVACQISLGTRGGSKQPPTLVPRDKKPASAPGSHNGSGSFHVNGPGSIIIPIPLDAGVIMLFVTAFDPTTRKLTAGDISVTATASSVPIQNYDPVNYPDWVPILPGADSVVIANASGDTYLVTVVFGIDG